MLLSYLKFVFCSSLIYFSVLGWSSNNWFMIWLVMELVFTFFVGLVCLNLNYSTVELIMKYFITQVFVSLIFSGMIIIYMFNMSFSMSVGMVVVLMIKVGMFPFHFWTIMVLGKIDWTSFYMMSTFMKLLPVLFLSSLMTYFNLNILFMLNVIFVSILGLNNIMVQKLLGYSSLVHLGWILISLSFGFNLFLVYYSCYILMMLILVFLLSSLNIYYLNQFKLFLFSVFLKFLFFFIILSIAGFPPFMGFVIKWFVVEMLLNYDYKVLIFLLLFFSVFSVFFYLELFFFVMMMGSISLHWYKCLNLKSLSLTFLVFSFYVSIYMFCYKL